MKRYIFAFNVCERYIFRLLPWSMTLGKKFQDVEFFLFCLCKYKLDTNVIPGEHIQLCTNIHRCYIYRPIHIYIHICLCNIKIIERDVLNRDTRGIIQIMITSRILWFVRANHYQVEKLFWCRKRLFAKK